MKGLIIFAIVATLFSSCIVAVPAHRGGYGHYHGGGHHGHGHGHHGGGHYRR